MAGEDTDLEADVRAAITGEAREEPAPEVETPRVEAEGEQERPRGPDGKFVPKVDKQTQPVQLDNAQGEEPARTILPPKSWTAAAKARFANLDTDIQQEVLKREKEIEDGQAQWSTKAEQFNRLDELFKPIDERLVLNGLDRPAYVRALIQADEMLRTNPNAALAQLAQMYGFQLPGGGQQQAQQADPTLQALQPFMAEFQQLKQTVLAGQQQAEQAAQAEVVGEVEAFSNDPKHIYFHNVRDLMADLIRTHRAKDLESAYDMACYADPKVRAAMQIKPVVPGKPARPKSLSFSGAPGSAQPPPSVTPRSSHEDDVRSAIEELSGRI